MLYDASWVNASLSFITKRGNKSHQWDVVHSIFARFRKQQTIQVKNKVEEKQLFCATQLSTTDAICKEGFNVNGSGVRICPPTKELPNYYFSRDANHSHIYSRNADDHGNYHVFLSKVLIGSSREKSRFMPRRQITSPSSPCPNPIDDFPVFVVRDADQVYPDILITYRLCL